MKKTVHEIYHPVLSREQAQKADEFTIKSLNQAGFLLMQKAGNAVCGAALRAIGFHKHATKPKGNFFFIFCGPGNNGGDGFVAAKRLWDANIPSKVICLSDPNSLKGDALTAFNKYKTYAEKLSYYSSSKKKVWHVVESKEELTTLFAKHAPNIIIDALFGTGLKSPLEEKSAWVVDSINEWRASEESNCKILSVDVPSGLSADGNVLNGPHIKADETITFSFKKIVHVAEPGRFYCGNIVLVPIGLERPTSPKSEPSYLAVSQEKKLAETLLNPILPNAHKGDFGHVLVLDGSKNLKGASRLSALAALRTGAGLTTILSMKDSFKIGANIPEIMFQEITAEDHNLPLNTSSVVIGPGLADDKLLRVGLDIVHKAALNDIPIVLDAGGLPLLKQLHDLKKEAFIVATPHPGEAARLLNTTAQAIQNDRMSAMKQLCSFANQIPAQVVWVLKGACPIVATSQNQKIIFEGGFSSLAIAGSGDVLSGLIAGLFKLTKNPIDAVVLGVNTHLSAGRYLQSSRKRGFLASELANTIPTVLYENN